MILTVGFWSFRKNNKKYPIFWEYDLTFSGFRVIDTIPKRKESVIMENKKLMTIMEALQWKRNCEKAGRNMLSLRSHRSLQMKLCCG